ncbi:MAG: substrate-binding domain-containing protein [Synergistaceae bacterium]|jgi:AI-2 transport system substrate-binding protein|nr:substrate-binding domain-containing protein [Synergistaceae bacterium]
MFAKKIRMATAALCSILAAASAWGAEIENVKILLIPKMTGSAFFEAAHEGARSFAARNGFTVEYRGNEEADVQHQISIIDLVIQQRNVDAICISALDAPGLDTVLKRAMRSGINVTTWDSDANGDARSLMVSQGTPDQLGKMLVEMAAKSLISRGRKPALEEIKYAWHYSSASVTDQNSCRAAGENYIKRAYPKWINAAPGNYHSDNNLQKAVTVGESIFAEHPDIDVIICNDPTSLPGQATAARNLGKTAKDVTITGFASPNAMRDFCKAGTVERWGLWDSREQGALACYMAALLASGRAIKVGDKINVPEIGTIEVMPNTVLDPKAYSAPNSGVILLPKRTEFTIENVDQYNF